jgi:hypothetical protein
MQVFWTQRVIPVERRRGSSGPAGPHRREVLRGGDVNE